MRRGIVRIATVAVLAAVLGGCVPKKVVWSPDGQRAAVVANKCLYLCDPDGKLSAAVVQDVVGDTSTPVAWFPDSRRILVVRKTQVQQWEEVASVISDSVREAIIARAQQFHDELVAYQGDWKDFSATAIKDLRDGQRGAVELYVRQHLAEGLAKHLDATWWGVIERASVEVWSLQIFDVHDDRAVTGLQIVRVIDGIIEVRIAPDGNKVAYVGAARETLDKSRLPNEAAKAPTLFVVPADGSSQPRPVADSVAWYPDWSPDSRNLVYAQTNKRTTSDGEDLMLGTISRRQVASEKGAILDELGGKEELAGILFTPGSTKIRCLPHGRILFSAGEFHLPATARDMPQRASLFLVDPERQTTVARVMPREAEAHPIAEGLSTALFEPSPDGTRVAIAHDDGTVAIFTLNSGSVGLVQADPELKNGKGSKLRTLPAWRSNDELCFAVPPGSKQGSPDRAEIMLWSEKNQRVLSKNWPAKAVSDLLNR